MSDWNLVDSSGWLEFLLGSSRAHFFEEALTDTSNLIVPVICIYEVVKRVRRDSDEGAAYTALSAMTQGVVVDLDLSLSLAASRFRLPLADSIIYATAQKFDAMLWTQDEDFEGLPNVMYFPK